MSEQASQRSLELFKSGLFLCRKCAVSDSRKPGHPIRFNSKNCNRASAAAFPAHGSMCGAVSGAIMGINLVAGRSSPSESIERCYILTQKLINQFEKQYGSVNCLPIDWL